MQQLISWYEPNGSPKSKNWATGLIAQFFFPTDKSNLDQHDLWVIKQLADHLRSVLRRERVELAIVGHADYRGKFGYNKDLAMQRVRSVTRELSRVLRFEPYFAAYSALAAGERCAVQGTRDELVLAGDRRVDVFSSTARLLSGNLPKLERSPQLQRVVYRHFRDFKKTSSEPGGSDSDAFGEGLEALAELFFSDHNAKVRGKEEVNRRQYRYFDALYRVNRVYINDVYTYKLGWGVEIERWSTDVKYEWGPPQPTVVVNYSSTNKMIGKESTSHRTVLLRRENADKDPFFFPPPLFKNPD
jgi:hypothetical protein